MPAILSMLFLFARGQPSPDFAQLHEIAAQRRECLQTILTARDEHEHQMAVENYCGESFLGSHEYREYFLYLFYQDTPDKKICEADDALLAAINLGWQVCEGQITVQFLCAKLKGIQGSRYVGNALFNLGEGDERDNHSQMADFFFRSCIDAPWHGFMQVIVDGAPPDGKDTRDIVQLLGWFFEESADAPRAAVTHWLAKLLTNKPAILDANLEIIAKLDSASKLPWLRSLDIREASRFYRTWQDRPDTPGKNRMLAWLEAGHREILTRIKSMPAPAGIKAPDCESLAAIAAERSAKLAEIRRTQGEDEWAQAHAFSRYDFEDKKAYAEYAQYLYDGEGDKELCRADDSLLKAINAQWEYHTGKITLDEMCARILRVEAPDYTLPGLYSLANALPDEDINPDLYFLFDDLVNDICAKCTPEDKHAIALFRECTKHTDADLGEQVSTCMAFLFYFRPSIVAANFDLLQEFEDLKWQEAISPSTASDVHWLRSVWEAQPDGSVKTSVLQAIETNAKQNDP